MRIAYIVTRADAVGGATIHVMEMARAMLERGHEAAIFTGGHGEAADKLAESGAPVHSLGLLRRAVNPWRDLRALVELQAALRDYAPNLVSAHTAKAGWLGRMACKRLGIPVIYTPHGLPVGGRMGGAKGAVFGAAERIAGPWARTIVCVSEAERRLAMERKLANAERLVVVHNGVRAIPARLRSDPAASPPRIISVARFEAPKDHPTLLSAVATLTGHPWELDLVGGGPAEQASRSLAVRLGIGERVRFLGYQADPAAALAHAQVFVLSSRSEAFPRTVLEAMRAGLAIVAANVGGVAEAIEDGRNGLIVPPADADSLAQALTRLITDAGLRTRLGQAARETFEARFRVETMVEKTIEVYAAALRRGPMPDRTEP